MDSGPIVGPGGEKDISPSKLLKQLTFELEAKLGRDATQRLKVAEQTAVKAQESVKRLSEKKKLSDAAVVKSKKNEDRLKGELDKLKEDLTKANNEGRTLANKVRIAHRNKLVNSSEITYKLFGNEV